MIFRILKNKLNKCLNNKKLLKRIILSNLKNKISLKIPNQLFQLLNLLKNKLMQIFKRLNKFKNQMKMPQKQINKIKIKIKFETIFIIIFPD